MRKDENAEISPDDQAKADHFAASIDLEALDQIAEAMEGQLRSVVDDAGRETVKQLASTNEEIADSRFQLFNHVSTNSLEYAKRRSAELVGKKWINGRLVDNPNPAWSIPQATRDELRGIIAKGYAGKLDQAEVTEAIRNADAFSKARAVLIARTEMITANARGSLAGYYAAKSIGIDIVKYWIPDANACPVCLENADAGDIELDEDFPSGDPCPTAHPHCECSLAARIRTDDKKPVNKNSLKPYCF